MRDINKAKRQLVAELEEMRQRPAELGKAEEKLRAMFKSTALGIAFTDLELNITDVNEAAVRLHGYSNKAELIGRNGMELLSKKEHARAKEDMGRTLEAGRSATLEYTLLTKDGKEFPGVLGVAVLKDMSGNPTGFVAISRDITKRRRVGRDLLQSRERYKRLFELSPIGIITLDMKGVITSCNPSVLIQCGHFEDELVGKNFLKTVPIQAMYIPQFTNAFASTIKGKAPKPFEVARRRRDGTTGWCEVHTALIKANGEKQGVLVLLSDITERKRMEHNLNERVKELQCLYSIADIAGRPGITLDEVFQGVVNLIPRSWQYPDITCARITIDGKEFRTNNYRDTQWKLSSEIKVSGAKAGVVEIRYLEERPVINEGPFLREERSLLDAIAEQLGLIIERKRTKKEMRELYKAEKRRQGEPGEE